MIALVLALALLAQGAPAAQRGVVSGRLLTRDGAPASVVRVVAIPAPPPTARPEEGTQYYVDPPAVSTGLTDEQGRYRLANIPPGRYLIAAGMLGQATYYPDAVEAFKATVVDVAAASETTLDFKLMTKLGGRVRGQVTPPPRTNAGEIAVLSGVRLTELLEAPVGADGRFQFGRVPAGRYLLNISPTPPGLGSVAFEVGDDDPPAVDVIRPDSRLVTGRIVVQQGPLPYGLLAFSTPQSYVPASINPDGTFTVRLHADRHHTEFAGLPSGYSLLSVRRGSQDVTQGFAVDKADIDDLVITVASPKALPRVRGTITGVPPERLAGARVEMRGPIVGAVSAEIQKDGTFVVPAITVGVYDVTVPQIPELPAKKVVVQWDDVNVALGR